VNRAETDDVISVCPFLC